MRRYLLAGLCLLLVLPLLVVRAEILPGDVAIVRMNNSGSPADNFSVVALKALDVSDVLFWTDNGWTLTNAFRTGEGAGATDIITNGLAAGEVINVTAASLANTGDQLFLFTNTVTAPQLMFGVDWGNAQGWDADGIDAGTSANPTATVPPALPPELAVSLGTLRAYIYTGTLAGTKSELLSSIANAANWAAASASNSNAWDRGSFDVQAGGGVVTNPPVLAGIGGKSVVVSNVLQFSVMATATEGDTVTLSMSNAPAGAVLGSTNEVGTFTWTPESTGVFTVDFYASDDDGADSESVTITVNEVPSESPRAGDLAVVQVSGVTNDFVYVVALTNYAAGTTIYATDKEWDEAVPGFTSGEDAFAFTFPAEVNVGDVFPITNTWSLSSTGEEFYLLTNNPAGLASAAQAGFIFAISWGADWAAREIPTTLTNHQVGLTGGGSATYTGTLVGTRAELITQLTNDLNWVAQAMTPVAWDRGNFTVSSGGNPNDADADGLPDSWETENFGTTTNQAGGDVDDDGSSNEDEFIAGTQPTNDASFFRASLVTPVGGAAIGFSGATGRFYSVDYLEDLQAQPQAWSNLINGMAGTNGQMTISDSAATNARVYRIGVKLTP